MLVLKALVLMKAPVPLILAVLFLGAPKRLQAGEEESVAPNPIVGPSRSPPPEQCDTQEAQVDFFEQMAGMKAVTKAFSRAGYTAVPFEIKEGGGRGKTREQRGDVEANPFLRPTS